MKPLEMEKLAESVEQLISTNQDLRQERALLQKAYNQLLTERDELIRKNEVARHKIESMLDKLKALEAQT